MAVPPSLSPPLDWSSVPFSLLPAIRRPRPPSCPSIPFQHAPLALFTDLGCDHSLMSSQQSPSSSSTPSGVQVVTLTVFSNGTSIPSPLPSSSGSPVPIGAIVGGAVGGMVLAVILVLIWKYWGRTIKRTDRKRRKEVVRSISLHPCSFIAICSSVTSDPDGGLMISCS